MYCLPLPGKVCKGGKFLGVPCIHPYRELHGICRQESVPLEPAGDLTRGMEIHGYRVVRAGLFRARNDLGRFFRAAVTGYKGKPPTIGQDTGNLVKNHVKIGEKMEDTGRDDMVKRTVSERVREVCQVVTDKVFCNSFLPADRKHGVAYVHPGDAESGP